MKNGQPIGEPFSPLLDRLADSDAFRDLPPLANKILVYMIRMAPRPYRGEYIVMSCRMAAKYCRCHFTTAADAMHAIEASGLAAVVDKGRRLPYAGIDRGSRWQLTFWNQQDITKNAQSSPPRHHDEPSGNCRTRKRRTPRRNRLADGPGDRSAQIARH
jgi:hypothetical protein